MVRHIDSYLHVLFVGNSTNLKEALRISICLVKVEKKTNQTHVHKNNNIEYFCIMKSFLLLSETTEEKVCLFSQASAPFMVQSPCLKNKKKVLFLFNDKTKPEGTEKNFESCLHDFRRDREE
ncbi:hypothetical protein YC2023_117630 [Brassica napus]